MDGTSRERLRRHAVAAVVQADVEGLLARGACAGQVDAVLRERHLEPAAARLLVAALGGDVDQDRARAGTAR